MTVFAMLLVPRMTQLDFTGPYEVFARCPGAKVELVWKSLEPVATEYGLTITPTATFDTLKQADVLFVPGGVGINDVLNDPQALAWARQVAPGARYVTAVCTGALFLGAAGLLKDRRATTHWTAMEMLPLLGATPVKERSVISGNVVTGGGVTAGIDFALRLASEMYGREVAQSIQLTIEYDPQPPFHAGHPDTAPRPILDALRARIGPRQAERLKQVRRAAERLLAGE